MKLCKKIVSVILTLAVALSATSLFVSSLAASKMFGDLDSDGKLTMKDVLKLRRVIAGAETIGSELLPYADVDFDGVYTMKDVLKLRRCVAGVDEIFPPAAALVDEAFVDPIEDWDQYDALIDKIRTETDPEKRAEMLHDAENILMATNCVIPIYYYNDLYLQKSCVSGIYSSAYGTKYFMYSSLSNGASALRVCLGSEPYTLDPALSVATDEACLIANLFSGLYMYDPSGNPVPACAESSSVSADGKVWTVTLKAGLKWSDGSPLTANDFEYAWKRATSESTMADYEYMFSVFEGYDEGNIAVTAKDDVTLEFTLVAPCAYMKDLMAFPTFYPVKRSAVESAPGYGSDPGAWCTEAGFVTNGAYVCTDWDHDNSMTFEKNPYWFDAGKVNIEKLEFLLNGDGDYVYEEYVLGNLDFADFFTLSDISDFIGDPEFHTVDELGTYYVSFNAKSPIFDGKTAEEAACMRRAVSILIDRDYICKEICGNGQVPANSFIPLGMSDGNGGKFKADENDGYFDVHAASLDRDEVINEAVTLLKAAGYKFGVDGKISSETPLTIEYITNDSGAHVAIAECIKADLADVGIEFTISTLNWADFAEVRRTGSFDLAREGWIADFNDPINMLEMFITNSGNNDCHFGE